MKWCPFRFDKQEIHRDCIGPGCQWFVGLDCAIVVLTKLQLTSEYNKKGEDPTCSKSTKSSIQFRVKAP